MAIRRSKGETVESTPSAQFLVDLYQALEPHVVKGHALVIGGDFNLHWDKKNELRSATFSDLKQWAHSLRLTQAARHRGHTLVTWRKSQALGACETEPDHIFVSKTLADSGAVASVAAFSGHSVNDSDHRPLVLEVRLAGALGLAEDGVRLPPPPKTTPTKMLRLTDDKATHKFREEAPRLMDAVGLEDRLKRMQRYADTLTAAAERSKGEAWESYGKDKEGGTLEADLESWWNDAATCLVEAQSKAHQVNLQARAGKKTKHHWSSTFAELNELYHQALGVVNAIDFARCGPETRSRLLSEVHAAATSAGRPGLLATFPSGRYPKGAEVHIWCKGAKEVLASLLKELHGSKRDGMRSDQSDRHAKVQDSIAMGKWKGLFRAELKRSFTSQNRHVVMTDVVDEDTGEAGRHLVTTPEEVKGCVRDYFAKWFGKAQAKWFRTEQKTHPLFRNDERGEEIRRALVRGTLTPEQDAELREGLPPGSEQILRWWRRKIICVEGERREIEAGDFDGLDLHSISTEEWLQILSRSSGNKAADAQGVHINMLKALLAPKRKSKCSDETENGAEAVVTARALDVLDMLRRALNITLRTGVVPGCLLEAVLCTIGKVEGSIDLKDSRPLTLLSIVLNLAVGMQIDKIMHRLDELKAIDDVQAGFRRGTSTAEPLLESRLVAEHCWQYYIDLWLGDEDKARAFDSPPEESLELAMDRLAIPYHVILLVKLVGNRARIRVRTAHGLADPFTKCQGFPQGGRHSPGLWTIFDDPLCTALAQEADSEDGDPVVVRVPFAVAPKITGKSYADDKRFMATSAEGMQRRFDMSSLWNLFNAVATNVKKSAVQALVQIPGGKWLLKEELPDITMTDWLTGESDTITKYDPDDPMKSLGMQTTAALSDGYARDEAKLAADRVAVCVAKGGAPEALWTRLITLVAERSALYKVRISCVSPEDMQEVQAKCHRTFKAKAGLCVTTPDLVVSSMVTLDWTCKHFMEQLVLVLGALQKSGSNMDLLVRAAMQHHALWQGGSATLGSKFNPQRGWDGTMFGRLHEWMMSKNLELRGPIAIPPGREHDCLLVALTSSEGERCLLSRGSWVVDAWRVSDVVRWDNSLTGALCDDCTWSKLIDARERGLGNDWCGLVRSLVTSYLATTGLGPRARGAIRLGAYVCVPMKQRVRGVRGPLALAVVVADDSGANGWDDKVALKILRPLYSGPDDDAEILRRLPKLPIKPPLGEGGLERGLRNVAEAAGAVFALQDRDTVVYYRARDLLEVKVIETHLAKELVLDEHASAAVLVQLDEDIFVDEASDIWSRPRVEVEAAVETFNFDQRDDVIGIRAAADRGWDPDWEQWGELVSLEHSRRGRGLRTTLRLMSDGSVKGDDFEARSTYGWTCYGATVDGDVLLRVDDTALSECILAGCGAVDGPPEWTSSTRAEATGALAALMGAITAGWKGDIDLRLDNDSAVARAGGLVLGGTSDSPWTDVALEKGHTVENSDIWTEFVAWRDRHTSTGARVKVSWHPGHPERRATRCDWGIEDRAVYLADQLAEAAHDSLTASREPTRWSHQATWRVFWRGEQIIGNVAKRLADVIRTEQLAEYLQGVGVGAGSDTEWLIPELVARTIGRRNGSLKDKVLKAKMVADILGTKHTRHRRAGLEDGEDALCRLCGEELETDSHVLWECKHPVTVDARKLVSKAVRTSWRKAGLGTTELAVAHALWGLRQDGTVRCRRSSDITKMFGDTGNELAAKLEEALLGHTLDVSGMYADRAGLFGKGWLRLLCAAGLERQRALNALAAVANTLQGPSGTQTIWRAFTTALDETDCALVGRVPAQVSYAGAFTDWAAGIRQRLRVTGVDDDMPYRVLATAGAIGMAAVDMADFACLVQDWIEGTEQGEPQVAEWAADLTEAIELAGATVANDRYHRGCRKITARDRARADAKGRALDRRQALARLDTTGNEVVDARSREILQRSIAKLRPLRKATKAAAVGAGRLQKATSRAKTNNDGEQAAGLSARGVTDDALALKWQSDARSSRAEARAALTNLETEPLRYDSRGLCKRRAEPLAGDKKRLCNQTEAVETEVAHAAEDTTRGKRGHDDDDSDPACLGKRTRLHRDAKRPADGLAHEQGQERSRKRQTRETASIGTTNLEPD